MGETICGMCLKKETFLNRISKTDSFYPNIVISELEQLKIEQEEKRQEEWRKQEELYKQQQQELFILKVLMLFFL